MEARTLLGERYEIRPCIPENELVTGHADEELRHAIASPNHAVPWLARTRNVLTLARIGYLQVERTPAQPWVLHNLWDVARYISWHRRFTNYLQQQVKRE